MPWNHFFPWIFLSCFLLVQSFRNSEFSPSDWFFAFELDLKTGIGFGRSKTLYKFLILILRNLDSLIDGIRFIVFQVIITEGIYAFLVIFCILSIFGEIGNLDLNIQNQLS